eukprot:TRINITY_DN807_c0_g1_i2.p1 TRINITY_DN807_c0_g1~~TRINITY_DN807_c0_g1_i2.p1  ORF type:complete len:413 (-),score=69.77 TRINITY_DN807_c0_g1_i2:30-1211(-)
MSSSPDRQEEVQEMVEGINVDENGPTQASPKRKPILPFRGPAVTEDTSLKCLESVWLMEESSEIKDVKVISYGSINKTLAKNPSTYRMHPIQTTYPLFALPKDLVIHKRLPKTSVTLVYQTFVSTNQPISLKCHRGPLETAIVENGVVVYRTMSQNENTQGTNNFRHKLSLVKLGETDLEKWVKYDPEMEEMRPDLSRTIIEVEAKITDDIVALLIGFITQDRVISQSQTMKILSKKLAGTSAWDMLGFNRPQLLSGLRRVSVDAGIEFPQFYGGEVRFDGAVIMTHTMEKIRAKRPRTEQSTMPPEKRQDTEVHTPRGLYQHPSLYAPAPALPLITINVEGNSPLDPNVLVAQFATLISGISTRNINVNLPDNPNQVHLHFDGHSWRSYFSQ